MLSLFRRSWAGANLTPGERALLKLVKGAALAALVSVVPVVDSLLNGQTPLTQRNLVIAGGAFAVAFLMALSKYYTSQGDPPLGLVLQAAAEGVATRTGAALPPVPPLPSDPNPPELASAQGVA